MRIENVWQDWRTECEIGRGASGAVYRCVRNDNGINAYAAVKVITVHKEKKSDLDSTRMLYNESSGKRAVDAYVNEIKLLESLKGAPNIVSIDDYKVVENDDCWQIFIRMELLTDLRTYFRNKPVTEGEVIKLGKDICAALTLCQKNNIVHRDIKPENIFVSRFGDFKIGDFGIAKYRNSSMGTVSFKGTYSYIAPETVREFRNDIRSDMYSLGLVMYELLCGRLPFIDTISSDISTKTQREQALTRRLSGEPVPPIQGVSSILNHAILKACAFNPWERFASPEDFAQALEVSSTKTTVVDGTPYVITSPPKQKSEKKNKTGLIIGIIAAVVVVLGILTAVLITSILAGDSGGGTPQPEDTTAEIPTLSYYEDEEPATFAEITDEDTTEETTEATEESTEETTTTAKPSAPDKSEDKTKQPQGSGSENTVTTTTTTTTKPTARKTVSASHSPYSYKETRLTATTSEPASYVIIKDTVPGYSEPWILQMKKNGGSGTSWYFDAEMLVSGTHTVIVTATFPDGSTATDTIQIQYPF